MKYEYARIECENPLTSGEKALYKRLVKRTVEEFLCIPCMAKHFQTDEDTLYRRIEMSRKIGCELFGKRDESN